MPIWSTLAGYGKKAFGEFAGSLGSGVAEHASKTVQEKMLGIPDPNKFDWKDYAQGNKQVMDTLYPGTSPHQRLGGGAGATGESGVGAGMSAREQRKIASKRLSMEEQLVKSEAFLKNQQARGAKATADIKEEIMGKDSEGKWNVLKNLGKQWSESRELIKDLGKMLKNRGKTFSSRWKSLDKRIKQLQEEQVRINANAMKVLINIENSGTSFDKAKINSMMRNQ